MKNPILLWLSIIGFVVMNVCISSIVYGSVIKMAAVFGLTVASYFLTPLFFSIYMLGEQFSWGYYWLCLAILSVYVCFAVIILFGLFVIL